MNVPYSTTRRIFCWNGGDMWAISSRNSVPPLASSNLPCRVSSAPVKAPFSWPNSSLSNSASEKAAQFTVMIGRDSPQAAK